MELLRLGMERPAFRFVVLGVLMTILVRNWPANRSQPAWGRDFWLDLQWFALHAVGYVPLAVLMGLWLALASKSLEASWDWMGSFLREARDFHVPWPIWAKALAIVVAGDFVAYWVHRLNHTGAFWRFHTVHHSTVQLDWLSVYRSHPVNFVIERFPFVLADSLLRVGIIPYALVALPFGVLTHANLDWTFGPLRYVFVSPVFHRWHHSAETEQPVNFGNIFSLWDMMFGTFYLPEGKIATRLGVPGEEIPADLLGQLAYPFRSAATSSAPRAASPAC